MPQKGSKRQEPLGNGPQRLIKIWASLGGSMPTLASLAGRPWSRREYASISWTPMTLNQSFSTLINSHFLGFLPESPL